MTKFTMYTCEECGFTDSQDENSHLYPNLISIRICEVCNKDVCEDCRVTHSKTEGGLEETGL